MQPDVGLSVLTVVETVTGRPYIGLVLLCQSTCPRGEVMSACHILRRRKRRALSSGPSLHGPLAAGLVSIMASLSSAFAAGPIKPQTGGDGTLSFVIENDALNNIDSDYTNGGRFVWTNAPGKAPGFLKAIGNALPFVPDTDEAVYTASYALGQSIFTSTDIEDVNPPLTDHPYAGWLNGDVSFVADTGRRFDRVTLGVGIVGPESFAEDVQEFFHDINNGNEPLGWDTQLRNEPTILLSYERNWRHFREHDLPFAFQAEFMPQVGVTVGNALTYVNTGAVLKFGQNIPYGYGLNRVRPGIGGTGAFDVDGIGWYIFGGAEVRAVARDIFLDGNSFRDSRSVDKETIVRDLEFGAAVATPWAQLAFTQVLRSDRFETQIKEDKFTTITLSIKF